MKKVKFNITIILFFLFVSVFVILVASQLLQDKVKLLKDEKYFSIAKEIKNQTKILIDEKSNATLTIGMSLALDKSIIEALKSGIPSSIKLKEFSSSLRKNSDFKNVWFQIIAKDGKSFYRSWIDKKGDSVLSARVEVVKILKKPEIMSIVSVGKFDMTFKSMVPIYDNGELLGIFEVITHFNSISKNLKNKDINSVILVDKKYKKQLIKPFTKLFIEDYYIANLDADSIYINQIKQKGVKELLTYNTYYEDKVNNNLITIYKLPDINSNPMGYFVLFKKISDIDMSDVEIVIDKIIFLIVFVIIAISIALYYFSNKKIVDEISSQNIRMKKLNDDLLKTLKEQKKLEKQKNEQQHMLFQQSKMASMGEMIGNIAHQWRQPIAIISMWSNNIIADIDMDEVENNSLKNYANNINKQTNHLSQTIDDFRNFFTPNKTETTFIAKNVIDKTMNLLSASLKTHEIEVIENIEDIEITLLENELMQVILNIIKNAKDILVTLSSDSKRFIFINIYKKENSVIIEIKDNGGGIPKKIINKIFEPYFTTKHKSQGTGIGLYMAEAIVKKHLVGKIFAENVEYKYNGEKYNGAQFTIDLPIIKKDLS